MKQKAREDGYYQVRINGKMVYVHRLSYELYHGVPSNPVIRHRCDVRCCVNLHHLIEGTTKDNVQDRIQRKGPLNGSNNGNSILTESEVSQIKQLLNKGYTHKTIAKRFNVSRATITHIKNKRLWSHIP